MNPSDLCTLQDFYNFAVKIFFEAGIDSPALDASVLISDFIQKDRSYLLIHGEDPLSEDRKGELLKRIQERSRRIPVSHITGKKEFYGRTFFVNENVLTPRPETEDMIDLVLKENLPADSAILDLCSGSGCIGITLLLENPGWSCDFSDISDMAMEVLIKNSETLVPEFHKRSRCFIGNLYEPIFNLIYDSNSGPKIGLQGTKTRAAAGSDENDTASSKNPVPLYNAVLCNPPYIHPDEKNGLMPELSYEPDQALFTENLPDLYYQIINGAFKLLKSGGILICELSPRWAEDILEYGKRFMPGEIVKDLGGLDRFVFFKKD